MCVNNTMGVISQALRHCLPWRNGLSLVGSVMKLGWLARESQGSSCLCFPNIRITRDSPSLPKQLWVRKFCHNNRERLEPRDSNQRQLVSKETWGAEGTGESKHIQSAVTRADHSTCPATGLVFHKQGYIKFILTCTAATTAYF